MREKITARFIVIVLLIVLIGAISVTMGGDKFTDPETYSKSIEILNEKRNNVIAMTGAAAGVSPTRYACASHPRTPRWGGRSLHDGSPSPPMSAPSRHDS